MTLSSHRGVSFHTIRIAACVAALGLLPSAGFLEDASHEARAQERPVPRPATPEPQAPPAESEANPREADGPTLYISDRQTSRMLESATELIASKDYTQAIQQLQHVLDNPEDFAYSASGTNEGQFLSAKREASRLIAALPREGAEIYEREYGPPARRILDDARETGNGSALAEVTRRYFYTQAGAEATYLLGTHALDQSDPSTAIFQFEKLLAHPRLAQSWQPMLSFKLAVSWVRAGNRAKAVEVLQQLKTEQPNATINAGGKSVPLFDQPDQAVNWLNSLAGVEDPAVSRTIDNWPLFRGDAARNPVVDAVPIGQPRWSVSTVRNTYDLSEQNADELAKQIREYEQSLLSENAITVPATHPLILGDVVVFRTLKDVRAARLDTGELLWASAPPDMHFVQIVERGRNVQVNFGLREQSSSRQLLRERTWRDFTWGTLSSDGKRVYAIDDLGFWGLQDLTGRGEQYPFGTRNQNRLIAYDLATGRIDWELGGPRPDRPAGLAGTFFLGAPLPVDNTLYCLGEFEGEVRLWAIDSESGSARWVQRLMFPDTKLSNSMHRRIGGTSPSYAGGLLICPTTSGMVLAIDPARREIAWTFRHSTEYLEGFFANPLRDLNNDPGMLLTIDEDSRWIDTPPTIADGCVLLAPRDSLSGELYCLDLADGSLKWKRRRGSGLYVAAVHDGKVIVVGRDRIEAWNLSNGRNAWQKPTQIPSPGGRGLLSGESYVLPLSTGEIATIDVRSGAILGRSTLADGKSAGNFAAARGAIIVQTVDSVERFYSLEAVREQIARDLERNPDDALALARRGELRLHLGETDAGLDDLRRSVAIDSNPRTVSLLVERLLERLRSDFAKHRGDADEIESLIARPLQRLEFYALLASGLEAAGDRLAAFQAFLKLSAQHETLRETMPLSNTVSTRGDRWLAPKISSLYQAADANQQKEFNQLAADRLETLIAANNPLELHRYATLFDALPTADRARQALIDRLDPNTQASLMELQLGTLRRRANPEFAGWATARLARLLIDRQRADEAIPLLDELQHDWENKKCLDDKTGAELAAAWRAEPSVKEMVERVAPWPERHLQAVRTSATAPIRASAPIRIFGPRSPSLAGWIFEIERVHSGESRIVAHDDAGMPRWSYPIDPELFGADGSLDTQTHAHVRGHLLLMALRYRLVAFDLLSDPHGPRILWSKQLFDPGTPLSQARGLLPNGQSGLVTDQFVCYQDDSTLRVLDILTGELLWERRGLDKRTHVFGDDEYLFIGLPRNEDDALVVRAVDGFELETRTISGASYGGRGRMNLNWSNQSTTSRLSLTDVYTGRDLWQHDFSQRANTMLVGDDEIAVAEVNGAKGKFTVLSIDDGRVRVEQEIAPLTTVTVFRTPDRYVLCGYTPPYPRFRPISRPSRGTMRPIAGVAYGFDRATGQQVWQADLPFAWVDAAQPSAVPILALRIAPRQEEGTDRPRTRGMFGLALLDTRNGKIFYRNDQPERDHPFDIRLDSANRKIQVQTDESLVEVTLTDVPHTEPPPKESLPAREPARNPVPAQKPGGTSGGSVK